MILPNVRASFGRNEAAYLLRLLAQGSTEARERLEDRLHGEGFDAVLDDPRTLNALMAAGGISPAPETLLFYVLVRHALLEQGITDRALADYLASLLIHFGERDRAFRIAEDDDQRYRYLVDIVEALERASGRRAFLLRAHLGNYALWLSGLFPDYVTARVERRGAPGLEYYEAMGASGFRVAAAFAEARRYGLNRLYERCAESFPHLRVSLNRIADRYMFPTHGDPVNRLLRQVADRFRQRN
jgi:hypothetical protein